MSELLNLTVQAQGLTLAVFGIDDLIVAIIVITVAALSAVALARPTSQPKNQEPDPADLEDFDIPTAEEDRVVTEFFGTCNVSLNCVGFKDLDTDSNSIQGTTVGYEYYLGIIFLIGAEIDCLLEFFMRGQRTFPFDGKHFSYPNGFLTTSPVYFEDAWDPANGVGTVFLPATGNNAALDGGAAKERPIVFYDGSQTFADRYLKKVFGMEESLRGLSYLRFTGKTIDRRNYPDNLGAFGVLSGVSANKQRSYLGDDVNTVPPYRVTVKRVGKVVRHWPTIDAEISDPVFTGAGDGTLDDLDTIHTTAATPDAGNAGDGTITGPAAIYNGDWELWTVECVDATTPGSELWSVTGSIGGLQSAQATTGVAFDFEASTRLLKLPRIVRIQFTINDDGVTPWAVGDKFTFGTAYCATEDWTLEKTAENATTAGAADPGNGGTGTMPATSADPSAPAETWTVEAFQIVSDVTHFHVTGSVSGAQADFTIDHDPNVQKAYANAFIGFTMKEASAGANLFQVGDKFTFSVLGAGGWSLTGSKSGAWPQAIESLAYANYPHSFTLTPGATPWDVGDKFEWSVWNDVADVEGDLNPAHFYYALYRDAMGMARTALDEDGFQLAARVFYKEDLGLSAPMQSARTIKNWIAEIDRHADARTYWDRTSGKLKIRLARPDYDVESLEEINENHYRDLKVGTQSWEDTYASLMVKYTSRETWDLRPVPIVNNAAVEILGGQLKMQTISLPMITREAALREVVARLKRRFFYPLIVGSFKISEAANFLNPNDVRKLRNGLADFEDLIIRVTDVNGGSPNDPVQTVDFIQDIFSAGPIAATPLPDDDVPPTDLDLTGVAIADYAVKSATGEFALAKTAIVLAAEPLSAAHNPFFAVNVQGGDAESQLGTIAYVGLATLDADYAATGYVDETIGFSMTEIRDREPNLREADHTDGEWQQLATLAILDAGGANWELVSIKRIVHDNDGTYACTGILRGIGATRIQAFSAGARVWLLREEDNPLHEVGTGFLLHDHLIDLAQFPLSSTLNLTLRPVNAVSVGQAVTAALDYDFGPETMMPPCNPVATVVNGRITLRWEPRVRCAWAGLSGRGQTGGIRGLGSLACNSNADDTPAITGTHEGEFVLYLGKPSDSPEGVNGLDPLAVTQVPVYTFRPKQFPQDVTLVNRGDYRSSPPFAIRVEEDGTIRNAA